MPVSFTLSHSLIHLFCLAQVASSRDHICPHTYCMGHLKSPSNLTVTMQTRGACACFTYINAVILKLVSNTTHCCAAAIDYQWCTARVTYTHHPQGLKMENDQHSVIDSSHSSRGRDIFCARCLLPSGPRCLIWVTAWMRAAQLVCLHSQDVCLTS